VRCPLDHGTDFPQHACNSYGLAPVTGPGRTLVLCRTIATPVGDLPSLFQQHEFGILAVAPSVVAFIDALQKALMTHPSRFQSELVVLAEEFDIEAIGERFAIGLFA
jgi:hypothetical protein